MPLTTPRKEDLVGLDLAKRWRIESLASEEMLGKVYVARDVQSGQLVHIKVLHQHLAGDDEKFRRFGRELTATRMVRHPNTVQVIDWGQHGTDLHFLVLEYLATHTLQSEIDRGPLAPERVAAIVAQVAGAIGAAHQEGIIHRNLSPSNILLLDNVPGGGVFAKVRDFGLSRLERFGEDSTTLTQAGARIGNVAYMAPEYIEEDRVHPKGDLYALGVLAYQMLVGQPPFRGKAAEVLTRHVTDEPPRPSSERPGLPRWCDEIVAALMAKRPDERPGAYQVVSALEQALGRKLDPPKLLGIDAEGEVVRPSRAPYYVAMAGAAVLIFGAVTLSLSLAIAGAWWLVTRAPELATAPEPDAMEPLPGAELPMGEPVVAVPDPVVKPSPAPRARPAPAPSAAPEPASPAPVAAAATLKIRANKRVLVYVDEVAVGYTPLDHPVTSGAHAVTALIPGKPDSRQERSVKVDRGAQPTIEFLF